MYKKSRHPRLKVSKIPIQALEEEAKQAEVRNGYIAGQNTKAGSERHRNCSLKIKMKTLLYPWFHPWFYHSIHFYFFTEMVGFIKLHCMQVNSHFYQPACLSKKKQWCVSETPIFLLCSMPFCKDPMAKLFLVTELPWIGNLEKGYNKKNCKTIIYVLSASPKIKNICLAICSKKKKK